MLRHEKIRSQIKSIWHDKRVASLCEQLLDFVVYNPDQMAHHLTYRRMGEILHVAPEDVDLSTAITILSQRFKALELHMLLFDDSGDEYELTRDELADYFETGTLAHPHTGVLLEEPESLLVPYFRGAKAVLLTEVPDER